MTIEERYFDLRKRFDVSDVRRILFEEFSHLGNAELSNQIDSAMIKEIGKILKK